MLPDKADSVGLGRRQSARLRLVAEGRLVTRDDAPATLVRDISETGAKLSRPAAEPFTWCILEWGGREIFGDMVWADGDSCGVKFHEPISHELVLAFKEQFPTVPEHAKLPVPSRWRKI